MSLQVQFFTFFMMFSSGWTLGIIFDMYRVMSRPFKLSRLTFSILDLVYWLAATLFVFRMLYMSNYGELRFFIFLGLMLGTWFYFSFISLYMIAAIKLFMKFVRWLVDFVIRCFQLLVIKPILLIYKLVIFLVGIFIALSIFLFKLVVQLLYPFWFVLAWLGRQIKKLIPWPAWMSKGVSWIKHQFKRFFKL